MPTIEKLNDDQGGFWEVRWRGPDGERKRRRNKAAANDLLEFAVEEERKRRDPLSYRASSSVSLEFVVKAYLEAEADQWEGSTRANCEGLIRNHLLPEWNARPIRHIHTGEIQNLWRALLNDKNSGRSSVLKIRGVLSIIFNFPILQGCIETNPVTATTVPKVPHKDVNDVETREVAPDAVLSPAQVRTLADTITPRYRVLVLVLGVLGLRIREAAALEVSHVDLDKGQIRLPRLWIRHRNAIDAQTA